MGFPECLQLSMSLSAFFQPSGVRSLPNQSEQFQVPSSNTPGGFLTARRRFSKLIARRLGAELETLLVVLRWTTHNL